MTPIPLQAFTARANMRLLRLITEVEIFPAFLPDTTPLPGKTYQGLYDTGASHSAISPQVVQDLNLSSIGARTVGVGGGLLSTTSHLVNISLPNKVMFGMASVAKMVIPGAVDVLIGMDILGMGDFAVTHHGGKTTFTFCTPSRREINFAAEVNAYIKSHPPSRNGLCPCNSGKKYKSCHGRRS